MLNVEKFLSLPETVESVELRPMFLELLAMPATTTEDTILITRALWELADRQWHNYERIATDLGDMVADWVISNWNPDSMKFVVNATGVVGRLGLPHALPIIEESLERTLAPEVRDKLVKWLRDVKPTNADPYAANPKEPLTKNSIGIPPAPMN